MKRDQQLSEQLRKRRLKGIIFDFDGVLLDVNKPLYNAIAEVLQNKYGIYFEKESTLTEIGGVLESIQGYPMTQVILHSHEIFKYIKVLEDLRLLKKLKIAIEIFVKYQNNAKEATFYPGAVELLKSLSIKHDLFILSNNMTDNVTRQLKKEGVETLFSGIFGRDKLNGALKPDPASLEPILNSYESYNRDDFLMIGDMPTDIQAGKEAGMWTIAVSSGLSSKEVLAENEPDMLLNSIADIIPLLEGDKGRAVKSQAQKIIKTET